MQTGGGGRAKSLAPEDAVQSLTHGVLSDQPISGVELRQPERGQAEGGPGAAGPETGGQEGGGQQAADPGVLRLLQAAQGN